MQKAMKSLVQLSAVVLALSTVGACANVITLRVAWQTGTNAISSWIPVDVALTPKSPRVKLAANQTAKILHFCCIQTNSPRMLNDAVQLKVDFGDMAVSYHHSTLNGKNEAPLGVPIFTGAGLPVVVGPATLELLPGDAQTVGFAGMAICTIDVSGTVEVLPGDTVVQLPQNNRVEVKLETSVNTEDAWQPATLGRFDATDQKRFFRLKIDKVE